MGGTATLVLLQPSAGIPGRVSIINAQQVGQAQRPGALQTETAAVREAVRKGEQHGPTPRAAPRPRTPRSRSHTRPGPWALGVTAELLPRRRCPATPTAM